MGISDNLVVFLCILAAAGVAAAGAATYRISHRHEFTEELPAMSNEQLDYMRMVRARNWPDLHYEARQAQMPLTSTNTSAV